MKLPKPFLTFTSFMFYDKPDFDESNSLAYHAKQIEKYYIELNKTYPLYVFENDKYPVPLLKYFEDNKVRLQGPHEAIRFFIRSIDTICHILPGMEPPKPKGKEVWTSPNLPHPKAQFLSSRPIRILEYFQDYLPYTYTYINLYKRIIPQTTPPTLELLNQLQENKLNIRTPDTLRYETYFPHLWSNTYTSY